MRSLVANKSSDVWIFSSGVVAFNLRGKSLKISVLYEGWPAYSIAVFDRIIVDRIISNFFSLLSRVQLGSTGFVAVALWAT